MPLNNNHNESFLHRISNILMLNGGFLNNHGLYTGDIGLALYFFRYVRNTQNVLYTEYAFYMVEKIQNNIHQETPISYKDGLAGIGSAIEYLVQNGFIDAHTDEILEDFDDRMFSVREMSRLSIEEVESIAYYAKWRMSGNSSKKEMIRQTILPQIENVMQERSHTATWKQMDFDNSPYLKTDTYSPLQKFLSNEYGSSNLPYEDTNSGSKHSNLHMPLGIQDGLSGLGLALLTELDRDDSWISLFPNHLTPVKE